MPFSSQLDRLGQNTLFLGISLFLLTAAVLSPAMSGGYIWDDDITLTDNPLVKLSLQEGIPHIWASKHSTDYYPLTWSSFWLEWRLWEQDARGYHIVNILLHACSAVLLWRIFVRLEIPGGKWTPWCAALLFAIHPICVDSVAWISQRKNTLSMVFYLAAILSYLKFDDKGQRKHYWLSALAFGAGLLSKSSIITLPLVIPCLLWFRHGTPYLRGFLFKKRQRSVFNNKLVQLAPFFILAAAAAFMTIWFQGKVLGYGVESGNSATATVKGALGASMSGRNNLGERLLVTGQAYWFYIVKLLVPTGISMVYGTWRVNSYHWTHYIPTISMVAAIVFTFRLRKRIGRGLCAALIYIAVALLPVLGFVAMSYQNYSWVANHLCYIAVPGAAALAVCLARHAVSKFGAGASGAGTALFVVVASIFAVQSLNRASLYQDPIRLWLDNIAKSPLAAAPYNELGIVHIRESMKATGPEKKKHLEDAVEILTKCIAIDPTFGKPYNNRGTALSYLGKNEEAIESFEAALRINRYDADSLGNLGLMYYRIGQPEKAIEIYERTLQLRLMSPTTYHNLGLALADLGRHEEASNSLLRALEMDPTNAYFHGIIGRHFYEWGNIDQASHHLQAAIRLGDTSAATLNTAAWIMATSSDPALRNGRSALDLVAVLEGRSGSVDPGILFTKAAALAELGRFPEAVAVIEEVIQIVRPRNEAPLLERAESELQLYQSGKPYREEKPEPVDGP